MSEAAQGDAAYPFLKGHGTENDFILLPDPDGSRHGDLPATRVEALCDRRAGIGADGVLRVVRSEAYDDPAAVASRSQAEWFMDYRNADGSLAETCGNGLRVFARYLAAHEHVPTSSPLCIGTRTGVTTVTFEGDGRVTVDMGSPTVLTASTVTVGECSWPSTTISMGNPHAVAFVSSLDEAGPLTEEPGFDRAVYPDGVNVEFVVRRGERHVSMRVHERGSGETRSCGSGACAVMVASALVDGVGRGSTYRVDVPGGALDVTWTEDDRLLLTGPAVLVAAGEVAGLG